MNKYIFKFTFSICFLLLFIQLGCGLLDSDDPKIERVNAVENFFTLEDFTSSGFKKLKKYKVKDLPGATAAFYGFYKFEDPIDYELRFYNTHEDALELGLKIAEERVGSKPEDVKIRKDDATWKEGLKEARFCTGPTGGATSKGHGERVSLGKLYIARCIWLIGSEFIKGDPTFPLWFADDDYMF